jgi:thioredoxin reductase (NADPH)
MLNVDTVVVGGGPVGLVASLYLARYRRRVLVLDARSSRASLIGHSHNYPGFPDGLPGRELIARLAEQAVRYGAEVAEATVDSIERRPDGRFDVRFGTQSLVSRTVVLATGVVDIEPELPNLRDAIRRGLIRHCPICDGFEVIGRATAVIGTGDKGAREALFIRHFTDDVTLFTLGAEPLAPADRASLDQAGVAVVETPIAEVHVERDVLVGLTTTDGHRHRFETLYSALGAASNSRLAQRLRVECAPDGSVITDGHQRTSVSDVYACGDIVHDSLNQIVVGMGHAAIAATDIHNRLRNA